MSRLIGKVCHLLGDDRPTDLLLLVDSSEHPLIFISVFVYFQVSEAQCQQHSNRYCSDYIDTIDAQLIYCLRLHKL